MDNILITGAAGFIGYHLAYRLLDQDENIIALDNFNNYYDQSLKEARFNNLINHSKKKGKKINFIRGDLKDISLMEKIFEDYKPNIVVNLAAQAGVRYSIKNPSAYIQSNIVGFSNLIELSKKFCVKNFLYASSSSVYGGNTKTPFDEKDPVNHPVSLYAATKRSNELMAHCYSHLFNLPCTGLRFFTVYGPYGRPDMAPIIFANSIFSKQPIKIYNYGRMSRDFTYIDDVIESLVRLLRKPARKNNKFDKYISDPSTSWCPFQILNIGNNNSVNLMDFIETLEKEIGIEAIKIFEPMQQGDVENTFANTIAIEKITGYKPNTSIELGVKKFISWFKEYNH